MEAGSAALRLDWPVYPRRAEHNTVAERGNRRLAETSSAESPRAQASVWPKTGRDGIAWDHPTRKAEKTALERVAAGGIFPQCDARHTDAAGSVLTHIV